MNYYNIMIFASGMYDYNNNKISVWNNYLTKFMTGINIHNRSSRC